MSSDSNGSRKSTLILGGTRSGKSSFAQRLAEKNAGDLIYLATAEAFDVEMTDRINRHREDRGSNWQTIEENIKITDVILERSSSGTTILIDCLTIWLSNLMLAEVDIESELNKLIGILGDIQGAVIFVSNEVGSGVVPQSPLGRQFRDEAGWMNQRIAANVEEVALITAGLPVWLKGRETET